MLWYTRVACNVPMKNLQHEHLLVTHDVLCGCTSQLSLLQMFEGTWKPRKNAFHTLLRLGGRILTKLNRFPLPPSLARSKLSWQMLNTIFESKEALWYNIIRSVFVISGIMKVFSSAFSLCADNTSCETYSKTSLLPRHLYFRPSQKPNRTIVLFSEWFETKKVEYDRPFKRCLEQNCY